MVLLAAIAGIIALAGLCCVVNLFEARWLELVQAIFMAVHSPISHVQPHLNNAWSSLRGFFHSQLAEPDGSLNPRAIFFHIIGAVFYTIECFAFSISDAQLMLLVVSGMGLESVGVHVPFGAGTLIVIGFASSFIFFGTILLDLMGMTQIAPWREALSPANRRIVTILCLVALIFSLTISVLAGYWRGQALMEPKASPMDFAESLGNGLADPGSFSGLPTFETDPDPEPPQSPEVSAKLDDYIPVVISVLLSVVMMIGATLAGWGPVMLVKYFGLAVIAVCTIPLAALIIVIGLTSRFLDHLLNLFNVLFQLMSEIGRSLLGLFGIDPSRNPPAAAGGQPAVPGPAPEQPAAPASEQPEQPEPPDIGASGHDAGSNPYD